MAELFVQHDPALVLKEVRKVLVSLGEIPQGCPSPDDCLKLDSVTLRSDSILVRLDANPPQLPPSNPDKLYDIHPVCLGCGISGNSNRGFKVVQDISSASITAAAGEWKSERY